MSKKKGIFTIAIIVLLTIFIGYTDVFGFGAQKTASAGEIKLGLDLAGGVSITYQAVDENPSAEQVKSMLRDLCSMGPKISIMTGVSPSA